MLLLLVLLGCPQPAEPVTSVEVRDPWTCDTRERTCEATPWCEGARWLDDGFYRCPNGGTYRACALTPTVVPPTAPMVGADEGCLADCGAAEPCFVFTEDGGCSAGDPGFVCGPYCCSDAQCGEGRACVSVAGAAVCTDAQCRVDSDCVSGRCKLGRDFSHGRLLACEDSVPECSVDADCHDSETLAYDPMTVAHCDDWGRCANRDVYQCE